MKNTFAVIVIFGFIVVSTASAVDLTVEKNGSGSTNSINVNQQANTVNQQESSLIINNNIDAKASTGNNTTDGNNGNTTIVTGDATVKVSVSNGGNTNINDPKTSPKPTTTGTPTTIPQPTNTPLPGGQNGSNNSGGGNGNNSASNTSANNESNGTGGNEPAPEILGLAATSSDSTLSFTTFTGVLCLALAGLILKNQAV